MLNNSTSYSTGAVVREDPWPCMEKQVEGMLNDLTVQLHRINSTRNSTLIAQNEVLEAINSCSEAVEDMRFAYDTAMEHPELFSISTEELQRRAERVRNWERDIAQSQKVGKKIRTEQQRHIQSNEDVHVSTQRENDDFLRQEHDIQHGIAQSDEQTLDRLSGGIHRLKETAVFINEEMTVQEHILGDIDKNISRVQARVDGAMRRVGKLLDQTSDRGKIICIALLFVILILLIFFVLK